MASLSFISTSKLASLIAAADPTKALHVRVLNATQLLLETASFQQVAIIDLEREAIVSPSIHVQPPVAVLRASRRSGQYRLTTFGEVTEPSSLKELLRIALQKLEEKRPGTLEKLSKKKKHTKRIVAENPSDLFDSPGLYQKFSSVLVEGWYYGTNNSAKETNTWLELACECAGVQWGKDVSTGF